MVYQAAVRFIITVAVLQLFGLALLLGEMLVTLDWPTMPDERVWQSWRLVTLVFAVAVASTVLNEKDG